MARSNKNHDVKKENIIQLALDLFLEHGYENTTITQIMRAANLSKGGMYHYFSSKEEILDAVIYSALSQELAKIQALLDPVPVDEKLIFFVKNNLSLEELTQKLLRYKNSNQNSLVAYRVSEANIHFCIPILQAIFEEGNEAGIYNIANPKEMAEFSMLLAKAALEGDFLPSCDTPGRILRMEVFIDLMKQCLKPSADHAQKLEQIFRSERNRLEEA